MKEYIKPEVEIVSLVSAEEITTGVPGGELGVEDTPFLTSIVLE